MRLGATAIADGTDPETAVSELVPGLLAGAQAALLLEAPMSVPVPDGQPGAWRRLGRRGRERATGPGRRSPCRLASDRADARCLDVAPARDLGAQAGRTLTQPPILAARRCDSSYWHRGWQPEPLPAGQDAADAAAARLALADTLDGPAPLTSAVRCAPEDPFNMLAAMALWAGLRIDLADPHVEVLVVAARPVPQAPR